MKVLGKPLFFVFVFCEMLFVTAGGQVSTADSYVTGVFQPTSALPGRRLVKWSYRYVISLSSGNTGEGLMTPIYYEISPRFHQKAHCKRIISQYQLYVPPSASVKYDWLGCSVKMKGVNFGEGF